ncbi:MAG: lysophospholipid acyltransferase family protein [bacterium]|nr:lysophospholipid acyltransferase family protein [bacterium]
MKGGRKYRVTFIHRWLGPWLLYWLARALFSTCRMRMVDAEPVEEIVRGGGNVIFGSWHGRLLALLHCYARHYGYTNLTLMVSQSRDGELFARMLARYKVETVRGSSSRGGAAALKELVRVCRGGRDTAISLDGSKGPRERVQRGPLMLAQLAGRPLVPLAFDATRKVVLKTWDRLMIPLPFSTIYVQLGRPLIVAEEAEDIDRYVAVVQEEMERICRELSERVCMKKVV